MADAATILASANLLLCLVATIRSARNHRLVTIAWLLVSYHAFFLIVLAINGPFTQHKGYSGALVQIRAETIETVCWYVFMFNLIFALAESLAWIIARPRIPLKWELPRRDVGLTRVMSILALCWLFGGVLYFQKMHGHGYRDYVESAGKNWPVVFLWASSPIIAYLCLQKRYLLALSASLPFVALAFYLQIRSFLLLSVIPAFIVVYFQQVVQVRRRLVRKGVTMLTMGLILCAISAIIIVRKTGGLMALPDAGMVYGTCIVFDALERSPLSLGFNSLVIYATNVFNPFLKVLTLLEWWEPIRHIDTPVHLAHLVDGVPLTSNIYFHYPALWYADAFVSFGWYGLLLAIFWGVLVVLWEALMLRHALVLGLFLPFYSWHAYMVIRGATAGAAVPLSYAVYVSAAVITIAGSRSLWVRTSGWRRKSAQ